MTKVKLLLAADEPTFSALSESLPQFELVLVTRAETGITLLSQPSCESISIVLICSTFEAGDNISKAAMLAMAVRIHQIHFKLPILMVSIFDQLEANSSLKAFAELKTQGIASDFVQLESVYEPLLEQRIESLLPVDKKKSVTQLATSLISTEPTPPCGCCESHRE